MSTERDAVAAIVLSDKPTPRSLVHVATEDSDFQEFAVQFIQTVIRIHKQKSAQSMYWLAFEIANDPSVPIDYEPLSKQGTAEQQRAWEFLAHGNNVCILGPGGTGKSHFIRWVKQAYLTNDNATIVTASTANAAFLLGGVTLHRMAGLPVWACDETKYDLRTAFDKYIRWVSRMHGTVHTICQMQLWICDEISMIQPRAFQLVDLAFRYFRHCPEKPFGGVQFLWSGDFLQIPPVIKTAERISLAQSLLKEPFLFNHGAWVNCWRPIIIPFSHNKRSQEAEWSNLLARVRMGIMTSDDLVKLNMRTEAALRFRDEWNLFMEGNVTHIYPTNADVKRENDLARMRLQGPDHIFGLDYALTTNIDLEQWNEMDKAMMSKWRERSQVIPQDWYPRVMDRQYPLEESSPWYQVLARSIALETCPLQLKTMTRQDLVNVVQKQVELFAQEQRISHSQVFRIGEKVRLTVNLAQTRGLVNGITGRIVGFSCHSPDLTMNWMSTNVRELKRIMIKQTDAWIGCVQSMRSDLDDTNAIEETDLWSEVILVTSRPRKRQEMREIVESPLFLDSPSAIDQVSSMHPIGQLRGLWIGSVVTDAIQDLGSGSFVWMDDPDCHGWPIVEWSTGEKTILPRYDWSMDYTSLMAIDPKEPKKKDRWMIHLYSFPIKPAHAITYHDSQGQTCERVYLGNVVKLFTANMLYVGLSRAPRLESVAICNSFSPRCIVAHPSAVKFFQSISDHVDSLLSLKRARQDANDEVCESDQDSFLTKKPRSDSRALVSARPSNAIAHTRPSTVQSSQTPKVERRIGSKQTSILSSLYCQ